MLQHEKLLSLEHKHLVKYVSSHLCVIDDFIHDLVLFMLLCHLMYGKQWDLSLAQCAMSKFQDSQQVVANYALDYFILKKFYWLVVVQLNKIHINEFWLWGFEATICLCKFVKCNFNTYESSIIDGVALRWISLFSYGKLSTFLLLSYPTKIVVF